MDDDDPEDDADTEHLPADDDIPSQLPDNWRERLKNPQEIAKLSGEVQDSERAADELKYAAMLDTFRVAAEVWTMCSRLHADAKTPSDRAQVKASYLKIGEQIGGVKSARWLERRRLGFRLREIHERTLAEQNHQMENDREPTFPSFNTISRRWFPSKETVSKQVAAERKQASDLLEQEYENLSKEERRQEMMEAADRATQAEQMAASLLADLEWERSTREATEKRHEGELAALREALAEREAEIERLRIPPITPDDPPPITPDPPITPEEPVQPEEPPIRPEEPVQPKEPPPLAVVPEERVQPVEPPTEPEDGHEAESWEHFDAVRASKLKARALVAADFPDLNDRLDAEEGELRIKRKRQMADANMEIATRRLRMVAARSASLTGAPDKAALLASKGKKWFVKLIAKPVGAVIAAVGESPADAESGEEE